MRRRAYRLAWIRRIPRAATNSTPSPRARRPTFADSKNDPIKETISYTRWRVAV